MSVSAGSCSLRSDRLSLLQLASLTTLTDSAAGSAASTGSTMLSPCWSRKNVCSPNKSLNFAIRGFSSGITRRFEFIQGLLDLRGVEFHRALLFQVCSKASPRDIASREPPTSRWLNATYALCVRGQVTTIELNEPVAPEFRNILPDELFQTVEIVPILETCLS